MIRLLTLLIFAFFSFIFGVVIGSIDTDTDYSGTYKNEKNSNDFFTLQKTNNYMMTDQNNKEKGMIRVKKVDDKEELFVITIFGETKIGEIVDEKIVIDKDNSVYKK